MSPLVRSRSGRRLVILLPVLVIAALQSQQLNGARNTGTDDVGVKIADVEKEITVLRARDRDKAPHAAGYAEQLARDLQQLRDEWEGRHAPARDAETAELCVVGFYQGAKPAEPRKFGSAVVEVQATPRPIVLALCAYEPVRWDLKLAEGALVEKVILGGYGEQQLAAPPKGVAVETHTYKPRQGGSYFFTYPGGESPTAAQAAETLRVLTGLPLTTLQGSYAYAGQPVIVGPGDLGWRRQRIMARLDPLWHEATAPRRAEARAALAGIRFHAIRWVGDFPRLEGELAEFTPAGWIEGTARPLPRSVNRVAADPRGPTWFGIQGHSNAVRVDLAARAATVLEIREDIPELSWPCGIAFDTKRNRLLVATLGGEGYLYAFDPAASAWSVLAEMGNLDLQSLTYSADADCLYGLKMDRGGAGRLDMVQFDPAGKKVRELAVNVEARPDSSEAFMSPPQLIAVDKHLVLLMPPPMRARADRAPGGQAAAMKGYLIDADTGSVRFSGELVPVAAPAAADGRALQAQWKAMRDAPVADPGAAQGLAAGGDAAVAAIRLGLPPAPSAPDTESVRAALAQLDSNDWKQREQATAALAAGGTAAEAELRRARQSAASDEARQRIDAVLKQLEQVRAGGMIEVELDKAVGDASARARLRAVRVLARIGTPAAVQLLREIAGGPAGSAEVEAARKALAGL